MNTGFIDLSQVQLLRWPEDKTVLAQLDLIELQCWMAGQNPQMLIWLGQDKQYQRFIFWHYLMPLKIKRCWFRVKRMFNA